MAVAAGADDRIVLLEALCVPVGDLGIVGAEHGDQEVRAPPEGTMGVGQK